MQPAFLALAWGQPGPAVERLRDRKEAVDILSDHPLVSHDLGLRADITTVIYFDAEVSRHPSNAQSNINCPLWKKKRASKHLNKKAPALKKCTQP